MIWRKLNRQEVSRQLTTARRLFTGASTTVADNMSVINEVEILKERLAHLEQRLLSYHTNRWNAIDMLADYLVGAELAGDYIEFGVSLGTTFGYAVQKMAPIFSEMQFIACDSFQGLPDPKGIDAISGFTSGFYKGQFACSEEDFMRGLRARQIDLSRVKTIKGWFSESLVSGNSKADRIEKVAAAWIDGDLYEFNYSYFALSYHSSIRWVSASL